MSRRRILVTALVAGLLTSLAPSQAAWQTPAGGWGFSNSTAVGPGSSPSPAAGGRTVSLTWPAATLDSGAPVGGYVVRRYDLGTSTELPIATGTCASLVATTSCTHTAAPPGSWRYTITGAQGAWRGPESPAGSVTVAPPALVLSAPTAVKPGTTLSGSLSGFVEGDSITYRLDSTTGPVLTGTLAGVATPTAAPASGTGSVTVTIPVGTPDGPHPVLAVASVRGESAAYSVTVDGTAPPAPVFTRTPPATSGDSATFEFTEADASATLECTLDAAAYAPCSSPVDLALLTAGSHTFSVRATDPAGNISVAGSFTWTVSLNVPNVATTFPSAGAGLNDAGFTAGCATAAAV